MSARVRVEDSCGETVGWVEDHPAVVAAFWRHAVGEGSFADRAGFEVVMGSLVELAQSVSGCLRAVRDLPSWPRRVACARRRRLP